jgi:hypothetical protein
MTVTINTHIIPKTALNRMMKNRLRKHHLLPTWAKFFHEIISFYNLLRMIIKQRQIQIVNNFSVSTEIIFSKLGEYNQLCIII